MGVAYHANYFVWFEMARTELMREAGCAYRDVEDDGVFFPVVNAGARYLAPARYDDRLEVDVRVAALTRVRVRFDYELRNVESGDLLATGFTEHGTVGSNGRPRRMPDALCRRLGSEESSAR
jgi:acyl-CoA thioester hydrolase